MIHETCSCGAAFRTDEPAPLKLVREWRKKHVCATSEAGVDAIHGGSSDNQVTSIGFMATGVVDPARSPYPEWDE